MRSGSQTFVPMEQGSRLTGAGAGHTELRGSAGTEAPVCTADIHRQHPGVGEPVPDVWNLRAGAGAAVQWAGPGRESPVSISWTGEGSCPGLAGLRLSLASLGWPLSRRSGLLAIGSPPISPTLCPKPGHSPFRVGGPCGSDHNGDHCREHSPRVSGGAGLAAPLDRDAPYLYSGRLGSRNTGPPSAPRVLSLQASLCNCKPCLRQNARCQTKPVHNDQVSGRPG